MGAAAFQLRIASPDFSRLVPIKLAAAPLQLHIDSLSRLCREKLQYEGSAVFSMPPDGGPEQWYIHRSYDPRLRNSDDQRGVESNLAAYTLKQREQALQRRACVERFRQGRMHGTQSAKLLARCVIQRAAADFPGLSISRTRLYEWDSRYQNPCDLAKLVDDRGGNRCEAATPAAWDAFRDLFLHENRPAVRQCWKQVRRLAAENGWTWCSYNACHRQLNNRIPPQEQARARAGRNYRSGFAPFIAQDCEAWRAGELWIADHKQLDLVCRWGEGNIRPWLSAWMDWRSRRVVGWMLSDNPNSTSILASLRHGLKDNSNFGGPRYVWLDNGKDYTSWMLHGQTKKQRREKIRPNVDEPVAFGILNALKIEAHFATPYNPNGKARLERWFRTLESFCKAFDTYTGDSIESKPERLNEILENRRSIPTFQTIRERLSDHITGNNVRTDHAIDDLSEGGLTLSPDEAMARWCDTRRVPADPESVDLLMAHWHKPVTVTRNGIAICLAGQTLHYGAFEQALIPFKAISKEDRRPVMIAYDPHDLRTVRVHDEKWRYVCTAPMNQVGGMHGSDPISIQHVAELNRQKSTYEKAQRRIAEHSLTSTFTTEEQLAGLAAESVKAATPAPSSMQIVQTPMDGQAEEIAMDQFKQAAGSESVPISRGIKPLRRIQPRDRIAEVRCDPFAKLAKLREQNDAR